MEEIKKVFDSYPEGKYNEYYNDWNWEKHDVFDEVKRPKDKVIVRDEKWEGGRVIPAKLGDMEVNRLAYPVEQDIVNKHTSFTVGREPILEAKPKDATERAMLEKLIEVQHDNKIKYHNKRVVRSWFSETIAAEYWWRDPDTKELRVEIWSPFRGDWLVPIKDKTGKLQRVYRFYKTKDENDKELQWGMVLDSSSVTTYLQVKNEWVVQEDESFPHGFNKIPVIYIPRDNPLCYKISTLRARIEELWSNSADCNDYHYAPKLVVSGDLEIKGSDPKGRHKTLKMENGADAKYLTWNQSPEMVKVEFEMLDSIIYQIMNTPRLTPKEMAETGANSGEAFKYVFASIGLAVEDHEEHVGEFLQRRINFLLHAIATTDPELKSAEKMRVTPRLVPYSIESSNEEKDKEGENK